MRQKPSTTCSEQSCPNQACIDCHPESSFCYSWTEELRRARNRDQPVTHVVAEDTAPNKPPASSPYTPSQEPASEAEDNAVKEGLLSSNPEELVPLNFRQRNEMHPLKCQAESYQGQMTRAQQQKTDLKEAISFLDPLSLVDQ